uniref:Uncharacterized protein n=1 Tax=Anguilla anguilla TaxID=7936 RepID=A0A0E9UTX0_ANGAN
MRSTLQRKNSINKPPV